MYKFSQNAIIVFLAITFTFITTIHASTSSPFETFEMLYARGRRKNGEHSLEILTNLNGSLASILSDPNTVSFDPIVTISWMPAICGRWKSYNEELKFDPCLETKCTLKFRGYYGYYKIYPNLGGVDYYCTELSEQLRDLREKYRYGGLTEEGLVEYNAIRTWFLANKTGDRAECPILDLPNLDGIFGSRENWEMCVSEPFRARDLQPNDWWQVRFQTQGKLEQKPNSNSTDVVSTFSEYNTDQLFLIKGFPKPFHSSYGIDTLFAGENAMTYLDMHLYKHHCYTELLIYNKLPVRVAFNITVGPIHKTDVSLAPQNGSKAHVWQSWKSVIVKDAESSIDLKLVITGIEGPMGVVGEGLKINHEFPAVSDSGSCDQPLSVYMDDVVILLNGGTSIILFSPVALLSPIILFLVRILLKQG